MRELLFTKRWQVTALRGPSSSISFRLKNSWRFSVECICRRLKGRLQKHSKMRHFLRNLCWVTMGFQDRSSSKFKTSDGRSCSIQPHNLYFPILRLTLNWTHSRIMIYPKLAAQQQQVWQFWWRHLMACMEKYWSFTKEGTSGRLHANQMIKLAATFRWAHGAKTLRFAHIRETLMRRTRHSLSSRIDVQSYQKH